MADKDTRPSIRCTAFACPHCGVYTTQFWYKVYASSCGEKQRTPFVATEDFVQEIADDEKIEAEKKASLLKWAKQLASGKVWVEPRGESEYCRTDVHNVFLSNCYNCKQAAIWAYDRLVFPAQREGAQPNLDLPEEIVRDFDEARSIVNASARGAAALLRLCIQKLCVVLGEQGKNIDGDIARLVSKGLDPMVQKSLDIVRVVGNESVHPGTIELNDNRDVAYQLFDLVNIIADQMISQPKKVSELYASLPENKKQAIERRDKKGS